jgi:hypothetical protein
MAAWPGTLPQQFEQDGYHEIFPEAWIRSNMDIGPDKIRKRYTAAIKQFSGQMFLTPTQAAALFTFWETTTDYGTIPFDWTHPRTGAAEEVRFLAPPELRAQEGKYLATIRIEVLP